MRRARVPTKRLAVCCNAKTSLLADAVEKGQNEPVEIFACVPVEAGFS